MDKVQIYMLVGQLVSVAAVGAQQDKKAWLTWLLTTALGIPVTGRIFGWW